MDDLIGCDPPRMTKAMRKRLRRTAITVPRYYKGPLRRPCDQRDPLGALAWDQTEIWMTAPEWLARLRRQGPRRSYVCASGLMGWRWVPRPRPCVRAVWSPSSTLKRAQLPDRKPRPFKGIELPVGDP